MTQEWRRDETEDDEGKRRKEKRTKGREEKRGQNR